MNFGERWLSRVFRQSRFQLYFVLEKLLLSYLISLDHTVAQTMIFTAGTGSDGIACAGGQVTVLDAPFPAVFFFKA